MNAKIMIVEDDAPLAQSIREYLTIEQFDARVISRGSEAEAAILDWQPDIVLLDVMLPGKDGVSICRDLRSEYDGIIIMFTAKDDEIDQVVGLEIGADDYLTKPVKPRILLAKLKAFLRKQERTNKPSSAPVDSLTIGDIKVDTTLRQAHLKNELISLTDAEYDLLVLLAVNVGVILSRSTIVEKTRGYEYDGIDRSVDNLISQLRKKLGDDPKQPVKLKTIRSKGYVLLDR
ncbi:response regulator [Vibrio sp. F74]|uniref:response regulator n=1 Tax=Vibrio sp. F74 TaxID=700020 RepID=UPI0035F55455